MIRKKTIEQQINDFLGIFQADEIVSFIKDSFPLFQLYDVDETDDWLRDSVGEDDKNVVRLVRTVYIVSKIADNHSGILATIRARFNGLWKRMEIQGLDEVTEDDIIR